MGEYFVPSKCCPSSSSHAVTEFKKHDSKDKSNKSDQPAENVEEVIMKKARFEVYKFAQLGLSNENRQKSQFDLALKLGAIPKKNKAINYKELKEKRKAIKESENERRTDMEKNIKSKSRSTKKEPKTRIHKKRKVGSGILKRYGQVRRK